MSSQYQSKNDIAWEYIFTQYSLLQDIETQGSVTITADTIRQFREPRLMAKFDHRIHLPRIFAENGLSILPVSRSAYCLSHFDAYANLPIPCPKITHLGLPSHITSMSASSITSEAVALNCALASGMLADFTAEEDLHPTVSGRMGTGLFDFSITNTRLARDLDISVANAQIEIDAALEGRNSLLLIEAKRDISQDFIIRQLFYPYRTWELALAAKSPAPKRIRPLFLVYSNGVFTLYEYAFSQEGHYNSLVLVRQKNYAIEDTRIHAQDVTLLFQSIHPVKEPPVPFPQADSFARVINLCELLLAESLSREDITQEYAFDARQTDYYTDAGRYLGLIVKERKEGTTVYSLTGKGRELLGLSYKQRQLALARAILEHGVFAAVFGDYLSGVPLGKDHVVARMREANLYNVTSESTYRRRASTVISWVHWIVALWH